MGKATALLLAREGAKVAVLSHTSDEIAKVAQETEKTGGEAIPVAAVKEIS